MAELAADEYAALTPSERDPRRLLRSWRDTIVPVVLVFVLLIVVWYACSAYFNVRNIDSLIIAPPGWDKLSLLDKIRKALTMDRPQPIVPTPWQTLTNFLGDLNQSPTASGTLWSDVFWTGQVALLGFLLGSLIGIALALLFLSSRILAQALMPYVVASQTVPIIALVPPLIVTIGLGLRSEILVSAYLAFFPIAISTFKGLQSVEPVAFDLMRSYAASRRQVFTKLRLPAALPFMFTGLKIGVTASLIGAVVAELSSGSSQGLGQRLVTTTTDGLYIPLWSTIVATACLGLILYAALVAVEKALVRQRVEPAA
jgi:NitT/TauT family transport system permease protein